MFFGILLELSFEFLLEINDHPNSIMPWLIGQQIDFLSCDVWRIFIVGQDILPISMPAHRVAAMIERSAVIPGLFIENVENF